MRVSKFHEHMSSLSVSKCTVCVEQFPGLQLRSNAMECVRCSRDKNSPKLYSPGNNMDPCSQPLELQVSVLQGTGYMWYCLVVYELMVYHVTSVQYSQDTVIILLWSIVIMKSTEVQTLGTI